LIKRHNHSVEWIRGAKMWTIHKKSQISQWRCTSKR